MLTVEARPRPFVLDPTACALIVIDMQRDFLEPGGFGAALGNDVERLRSAIEPIRRILDAARAAGLPVLHTREGHMPDLSDLPEAKHRRPKPGAPRIGDTGPMGRILIRGEVGHAIISELQPIPGESVVDKPGKGAFFGTPLQALLSTKGVRQLIVTGVTTEICVQSTVREANDRGYECLVPRDATASYFPEFHEAALDMIAAQGGILGWVTESQAVLAALKSIPSQS